MRPRLGGQLRTVLSAPAHLGPSSLHCLEWPRSCSPLLPGLLRGHWSRTGPGTPRVYWGRESTSYRVKRPKDRIYPLHPEHAFSSLRPYLIFSEKQEINMTHHTLAFRDPSSNC